jgi:hypothetical protein
MYQIEGFVLDYINTHNGYINKAVAFDKGLWELFGLTDEPFKIRRLSHYVQPFQRGERPCPVCDQLRPFDPRRPNTLCRDCMSSPDFLDSKGERTTIVKQEWVPLSPGFFTCVEEPVETSFTLHEIPCRRGDTDDLEAVALCPVCKVEVNEERRLGAFCDRCARSEWLIDVNGNRVHFEAPVGDEYGFQVVSYQNGEIVSQPHVGEFVCFFQDIPCIADDCGSKARVIVRFRDRVDRSWKHGTLPSMTGTFYIESRDSGPDDSDWLDPGYPRWATC